MPHFYDELPPSLQKWALEQSIFFTASAPLRGEHINLSPKGRSSSTFAILDSNHVAYLDLTGSGAETIAHIYENARVTVMLCSFTRNPRILRLYCTGRVVELDDKHFDSAIARTGLKIIPGTRAVVLLDIWKVQTSCGYAVPVVDNDAHPPHSIENADQDVSKTGQLENPPCRCFQERYMLDQWLENKINKKALDDYQIRMNSWNLDGLPAMRMSRKMKGEWLWVGDCWALMLRKLDHPEAVLFGFVVGVVLMALIPQLSSVLLSCLAALFKLTQRLVRLFDVVFTRVGAPVRPPSFSSSMRS